MKFTADDLRAAYAFLKRVAFQNDRRLPAARNVQFYWKPLEDHGYHDFVGGRHHIWIDSVDTHSMTHMLQILAHEMGHVMLLPHQKMSGDDPHDAQFRELMRVVEIEMGWPKGSV
jgi:hypothetical protein